MCVSEGGERGGGMGGGDLVLRMGEGGCGFLCLMTPFFVNLDFG